MQAELNDKTFAKQIAASKVVFVDFTAKWCAPCEIMQPVLEALSNEYAGRVLMGKVDFDKNPKLVKQYGIDTLPSFVVLKDGKVVETHVGGTSSAKLREMINKYL